jgi:rare lipoprotein A (peptidoglycan hydrolase)
MFTRARNALSGVVVSVLLMGPALGFSAHAEDSAGRKSPLSAEPRKTASLRQARHGTGLAHRLRHAATHLAASSRTEAFLDDGDGRNGGMDRGLASWYGGRRWQGKRTSSGSLYDQNALTAAHATLPLGTRVRVTVVDTGRNVVVTIDDRPGTRQRIIDLSRAAARELGILERGVAMVTLSPL